MKSKYVLTFIVLFILINAVLFLILYKDTFFKKQSPLPSNSSNNLLPSEPRDIEIGNNVNDGVILTYNYKGKITEIIPKQNGTEIKLDTSIQTPELLITNTAQIFKANNEIATISDLKIGTSVDITVTLNNKIWTVKTVNIQEE